MSGWPLLLSVAYVWLDSLWVCIQTSRSLRGRECRVVIEHKGRPESRGRFGSSYDAVEFKIPRAVRLEGFNAPVFQHWFRSWGIFEGVMLIRVTCWYDFRYPIHFSYAFQWSYTYPHTLYFIHTLILRSLLTHPATLSYSLRHPPFTLHTEHILPTPFSQLAAIYLQLYLTVTLHITYTNTHFAITLQSPCTLTYPIFTLHIWYTFTNRLTCPSSPARPNWDKGKYENTWTAYRRR